MLVAEDRYVCQHITLVDTIVDFVPPGAPGNLTTAGIPIYGTPREVPCGGVFTTSDLDGWAQERARIADISAASNARADRRQAELEADTAITDVAERAIRLAARLRTVSDQELELEGGRRSTRPSMFLSAGSLEFMSRMRSQTWSSAQLATTFARLAREAGTTPDSTVPWPIVKVPWRKPTSGAAEYKDGPLTDVWIVPSDLLEPHTVASRPDALIARDGSLFLPQAWHRGSAQPAGQLSEATLLWLAHKLNLPVTWLSTHLPLPA